MSNFFKIFGLGPVQEPMLRIGMIVLTEQTPTTGCTLPETGD